MTTLSLDVPRKLAPLLKPSRYKALRGGRGGGKSHFIAEQVVCAALEGKRIVCIREVQGTLRDSSREVIIGKIIKHKLGACFEILDAEIRGVAGTPAEGALIIFKGMQTYNAENIKSLEAFDVAWVEEAQTFSATSLRLLRPTIRKPGSELWFSWNTRYETDAVDAFFFGENPPRKAIIVEINWYDNPWITNELIEEKDDDYAADEDNAENVWGGGYVKVSAGAYWAKQITELEKNGKVGQFLHDPSQTVFTSWDLGVDDYTSIWFFHVFYDPLPRIRIIDFYEASDMGAEEIIKSALPEYTKDIQQRIMDRDELGRDVSFKYGTHFFPHDIGTREWGAGAKTRIETINALGIPLGSIRRGVAANPEDRINAVRQILPLCEFNDTPRVKLGLKHLRRYSKKVNERLGIYLGPLHDEHSHASDAFGEFAINCGISIPKPAPPPKEEPVQNGFIIAPPARSNRQTGRI